MRQPQSGRICRSPRAVPMMTRTDSSMFCSYLESWMPPLGPTEKGNLKPTPRKLLMPVSPQVLHCALRGGDPHLDDPLAIRAAHDGAAPPLFHHEPFGEAALGADEPLRPAGGDRLDDLVPERFQLAQAVLRALRHFGVPPLSQLVADSRRSRSREGASLVRLPPRDQVGAAAPRQRRAGRGAWPFRFTQRSRRSKGEGAEERVVRRNPGVSLRPPLPPR